MRKMMNMDKTGFDDEKRFFKTYKVISIWLATLAVIILILLIALSIKNTRERDMVEQFSKQQIAIVRGTAAGIEDFLIGVEKSMIILSRLPCVRGTMPETTVQSMKVIYDDLEGKVEFIAVEDKSGVVITSYPSSFLKGITGKNFGFRRYFQEVSKTGKPYISDLLLVGGEKYEDVESRFKSIIVAVPKYDSKNEFSGVVLAALSFSTIIDRYIKRVRCGMSCSAWIVDDNGVIVVHPDAEFTGKDAGILEGAKTEGGMSLKSTLLKGQEGYGEYMLREEGGRVEKNIVAYVPIHLGSWKWAIAINVPRYVAISLLRETFFNIMIIAFGLIAAVIIGSTFIVYSGRRHLRVREELKHLREKEDWQEKLIREHKTIEGIIEGSPIPTFVVNREHKVILWNKACEELTGFDARDMIGTDKQYIPFYSQKRPLIADFIVDHDIEGLERYYGFKEVRKSENVEGAYEARDIFKNLGGKKRHLYFLAAPIYDERGEIAAAIETLQDVSKEKEMEISLAEYAETLQNELTENINLRDRIENLYNHLRSILDSSPDKLFEISGEGIINYISRDMNRGDGFVSRQVKGKHIADFVAPEIRDITLAKWEDVKRGIYTPYEVEVTARDGSKMALLITPCPVKGTDRYVYVQRDITEFKDLERKFYESQKLAAVGQLAAGIAHEVRNPLSSIKMSLQILEKRMQPSGNDSKRFRIAQREVDHLEKLVNDILVFAKPSDPQKKPSDIKRILEHALAMVEKPISDKGIHIMRGFEKNIPPIRVDPAMLEQSFINIYQNAIDAMEAKGRLFISTKLIEDGGKSVVLVEIEDDGCGIGKEDMLHLWNPFFTMKKYGTGLGLTQVKKIVDLHQGTLKILSKKGEGTKVMVTLPIEQEQVNSERSH